MRILGYWFSMNKEIENLGKTCKNCVLAAKAPPVKFSPRPKTDKLWSRLHIDHAGLIKRTYYFNVVDSFTKWPEGYNVRQFSSKDFEHFCKTHSIVHISCLPYLPRSNRMAESCLTTQGQTEWLKAALPPKVKRSG